MKIEFLTENIERHLSTLSKNIPSSAQVPILSNILLKASSEGFIIQATDLDLGIEIKIPAKIEEEGEMTVPGRQFIETINSLSKDKIILEKEGDILNLKSRRQKIKFQTTPSDDFPTLFEEKGEKVGKYSRSELESIFSKLLFSASQDDTRPELTGIYIKQYKDYVDYVTTDGFRLSRKKQAGKKLSEEGEDLIIPQKIIHEVLSLKCEETEMFVNKKGNQIVFDAQDVVVVGRMLHGSYPNYERVIPQESEIKIEIPKDEFLQNLKLSSIFARENSNIVRCNFKKDTLTLKSNASNVGEQESEVEIKKEGEDIEVSFNAKYLQDALRAINGDIVRLGLNTPQEPALFTDEKDKDYLHVVMPVRV